MTDFETGFKVLVELGRKLNSDHKIISNYAKLFDDYPLPAIINSGCIKLSDLFLTCCVSQKHSIYKVFEQSKSHLSKIINLDYVVSNVSAVFLSNDPIARTIALKMYEALVQVTNDFTEIHFNIKKAFDTATDRLERQAACSAARAYSSTSKEFAIYFSQILSKKLKESDSINSVSECIALVASDSYNSNLVEEAFNSLIKFHSLPLDFQLTMLYRISRKDSTLSDRFLTVLAEAEFGYQVEFLSRMHFVDIDRFPKFKVK